MAKQLKVKMTHVRTTKGGHWVYDDGADTHAKTLYLRPNEVKDFGEPEEILVTIQV